MNKLIIAASTLIISIPTCFAETVSFPSRTIIAWKNKSFLGSTDYSIIRDDVINSDVIQAKSDRAASGLFYEKRINLKKTPFLNWSWRIEKYPEVKDEKSKPGDDFAARVYIVVKTGWTFLSTRAISYVWSQQNPEDSVWPNPFTGGKAMMVVAQSGTDEKGWVSEQRNIREDLQRLFGENLDHIDAIAIMTDTDNSKSSAIGYYAEVRFSED